MYLHADIIVIDNNSALRFSFVRGIPGTAEPYGKAYPPNVPYPYAFTTLIINLLSTGEQRRTELSLNSTDAAYAPIYVPFKARGVLYAASPVRRALSSPGQLPPARLVIHRQTLCCPRRKNTLIVETRFGIGALLHYTPIGYTDNGRATYLRRAPRGGCCLGRGYHLISPVHRVSGSEPLYLRNT